MILKWAVAAVLFYGEVPLEQHVFFLDPAKIRTEKECKAELEKIREGVAKENQELTLWGKCIEIDYKARPVDKSKPSDKKSEVTS